MPDVDEFGAVLAALPDAAAQVSRVVCRVGFEQLFLPAFYADGRAATIDDRHVTGHFKSPRANASSCVTLSLLYAYMQGVGGCACAEHVFLFRLTPCA